MAAAGTLRHHLYSMTDPIQLLHVGPGAPDLGTAAYGPFVVHAVDSLDELADALEQQPFDAVVLSFISPAALAALAGPAGVAGLSRAVIESAVIVVAPEPETADALRLLRLGVQDVLPRLEATPQTLARVVRLAVERKQLDSAVRNAYASDLATGLPNHAQLMEHMTHLLALREREPAAMALLAVRLDGLAVAEAQLGAEAANVLRRKAAVRLRSGLRASDVVASIGSDTFAVLLAWIDEQSAGAGVAAKLLQTLQRPFTVAGQELSLAVSVGVGQYPAHGKDAHTLLRRALTQAAETVRPGPARKILRSGIAANDET